MRFRRATLLGLVGSVFIATSAMAADVPPIVIAPPAPPPPVAATFDWAGPYVGAYGGAMFGNAILVGVDAGYAFQFGNFVASIEAAIGVRFAGPTQLHVSAWARVGPTLGDRVWLYGLIGWSDWGTRGEYGGGLALAINDNMSVRADVSIYCCWSPIMIKVGVNFHPGN